MLTIREFRAGFFDAAKILKQVDRETRARLSKLGAFVRTRARSSIRTRKAISLPGQPPSSHEGSLRRLILFAWDEATRTVVVGAAAFKAGRAPGLLEFGGTTTRGSRTLNYRPRPYMKPAGDAELAKHRQLLKGMVT